MNEFHVGGETEIHEGVGGETGGGENAALVTAELALEDTAVEVGPALVRDRDSGRLPNDVNVVTVSNDEQVLKLGLELGENSMDGQREEERAQRAPLLAANRVHDFAETRARFMKEDARGIAIHELHQTEDRREIVEKWLPKASAAPAVEGIPRIEGAVDVVGVEFQVS
jgi:hypothetical protein